MTRDLDATRSPMAFFGAELRRVRVAAGLSQEQLGRELNFSGDLIGKIETSDRAPSPEVAAGCSPTWTAFSSAWWGWPGAGTGRTRSGSGAGWTPSARPCPCAGGNWR